MIQTRKRNSDPAESLGDPAGSLSDSVDVAIVGAGLSGLSAAVHARLAGLTVRAFERHESPGGLCTAWTRKGYVFDYCIHWLIGSSPKHPMWKMWQELGATQGRKFINHEIYSRYTDADGRIFDFAIDPDRLEANMAQASPEDAKLAAELRSAIQKTRKFKLMGDESGFSALIKMIPALPALGVMGRYSGLTIQEWCARLESPFLREAILNAWGFPDFPMSALIMAMAMMAEGSAGYPLGGSLPFSKAVAARAKSLGADLRFGCGVRRVLCEGGKAIGVELEDGRVQRARYVVAACDAKAAFDRLLEGRLRSPAYEAMFADRKIFPSLIQASLGLRVDPAWELEKLPSNASYPLKRPIIVDGRPLDRIGIHHYAYDPLMAPEGRTVILVRFDGDYEAWKARKDEGASYQAEKERILADTISALEEAFPGIAQRVEARDLSTPLTCERYTGNWRGSMEGWLITTETMRNMMRGRKLPKTFPELAGFSLIGQWTEPGGGLPPAAMNGREIVDMIAKAEKNRKKS